MPRGYKNISCSTKLSMKVFLLINVKMTTTVGKKKNSCSTKLSMELFLLINVKMPTTVGILTFMSRKNGVPGLSEPEKC